MLLRLFPSPSTRRIVPLKIPIPLREALCDLDKHSSVALQLSLSLSSSGRRLRLDCQYPLPCTTTWSRPSSRGCSHSVTLDWFLR